MLSPTRDRLFLRSQSGCWEAHLHTAFLDRQEVRVDKQLFAAKCQEGCRNYAAKHTCPPYSPSFEELAPSEIWLLVLALRMPLNQLPRFPNPYHQVRMANSMMRSRLGRILDSLRASIPSGYPLGSGSCRRCRRCARQDGRPCVRPDLLTYSLEAVGVDCGQLVRRCFDIDLQWYRSKTLPQHSMVVGGVLTSSLILVDTANLLLELERSTRLSR
ncbi:MAG: DUF2284 domain-containing protein [Bacillota bacterium]|nr:DUF2284 domain-containing protein [Bacillota bacterium]